MTKQNNMKTQSDAELAKNLGEARAALRTLRFEAAGSRAKESNAPYKTRKDIARILTEQNARCTK